MGVEISGSLHSGAATSEVLSPVVELDQSPFSSLTESAKTTQLSELNSQLSRINSRAEGVATPELKAEQPKVVQETNTVQPPLLEPEGGIKKERKISRFKVSYNLTKIRIVVKMYILLMKVSVVTEPDPSKLILPVKEKKPPEVSEPVASTVVAPPIHASSSGNGHAPSKEDKADVKTIINDTFNSLANVLAGSLPPNQGKQRVNLL